MEVPAKLNEKTISAPTDPQKKLWGWANLAGLSVLAIYFYVLMEWLFFVTKPSFMDLMSFGTKFAILLLCGLFLALAGLSFLLILFGLSYIPWWSKSWKVFLWVGGVLPAVFIASTALLLIDNFTYTMFKFGIVSTQGYQQGIYGLLFLLLLAGSMWWVIRFLSGKNQTNRIDTPLKMRLYSCAAILLLSISWGGSLYLSAKTTDTVLNVSPAARLPNILLIGSDGLNAEHMSLYGYKRDTTPFLKKFAQSALLAENNFPNANISAGSVASIFTGKLPTQTRMLYPPDILKGTNAIQHFPGILKKEGYYNAEVSVDYYIDGNALNLQDSFATVNGRSAYVGKLYTFSRRILPEDVAYFMSTIGKRLYDRVFHIYYIRRMRNPYAEVNQILNTMSDQDRVNAVMSLYLSNKFPLFIHVHMMGTHGGDFNPRTSVFSKGEPQDDTTKMDFYDDAVLDFDTYMRDLMDQLAKIGKLDETMIILYTDHGMGDVSNARIPLFIRFPKGEYAGKIVHNTQNIDIAPTILDYMGIKPPNWMSGLSLLKGEPPATRPIFSAQPNFRAENDIGRLSLDLSKVKPPFYQFGKIGMVICQKWYALSTSSLTWEEADVQNYPTPCSPDTLPSRSQVHQMMFDQLKTDGFDVSSLNQ